MTCMVLDKILATWIGGFWLPTHFLCCFSVVFIQGKSGVAGGDQTESTDAVEVTETAEAAS